MANTTNTCVINITFTKATSRSNIVSGDNLSNACGKIAKYIETSAGEIVAGKSYVIDGSPYIAGDGAEVFNDYTNNKAVGNYSHAEGYYTTARLTASHAEGWKTEAGNAAHAEGHLTIASGSGAHAEGSNTIAKADRSHAEGYYTTAQKQSQHVEGEYNVLDTDSTSTRGKFAHIIGNGTSDNARSNALAVDWDGKIYQPSDPNADPNGVYLSSKVNTSALAPVATSGSFSDLSNKPSAGSQGGSGKYIQSISQSNGTITATPATLSTTLSSIDSVAPTTNAVYQPVLETINNGVKNISRWSGGTAASANQTIASKIPITTDGDTYVISYATSLTTGYITVGIKDANDALVVNAIQINNFGTKTVDVTIPSNAAYFNIVSSVAGTYSNFMICKKKLYDLSDDYRPYAPSNSELYEMIGGINSVQAEADAVANAGAKNMLTLNPPSTSSGGVTLAVNTDGTITTTGGTSTSYTALQLNTITLPAGEYILSGCPTGGSDNTYRLDISGTQYYDTGSGVKFTSTGTAITIRIRIGANTRVNGFIWKPMIRNAAIADSTFQQYAPTNRELYEMILALYNRGTS